MYVENLKKIYFSPKISRNMFFRYVSDFNQEADGRIILDVADAARQGYYNKRGHHSITTGGCWSIIEINDFKQSLR